MVEEIKLKASIVICTLNNLDGLKVCIKSIEDQDYKPHEVIIVHAGDYNHTEKYINNMKSISKLNYIFISSIKSLVIQRNIGIKNATGDVVFYIDDDATYASGYLTKVMKVYENNFKNNLGGVQGTTYQRKIRKSTISDYIRILFFANVANGNGTLQRSGYPSFLKYHPEPQYVEVFSGCNMSFRRNVLNDNEFNQQFEKYWWGDDFEMSYRISKDYKLMQIPDAIVFHEPYILNKQASRKNWMMTVINRKYIFDKYFSNKIINHIIYYWSIIGDIMIVISQSLKLKKLDPIIGFVNGYRFLRNSA